MVTFTLVPATPGGAVACTTVVDPQSRRAAALLIFLAALLPKNTPVTQPRFWPVIVTLVPPAARPDAGLIEVTTGLPGGNRKNLSAGGCDEQPVTLQTRTSTTAGFCCTVRELMRRIVTRITIPTSGL